MFRGTAGASGVEEDKSGCKRVEAETLGADARVEKQWDRVFWLSTCMRLGIGVASVSLETRCLILQVQHTPSGCPDLARTAYSISLEIVKTFRSGSRPHYIREAERKHSSVSGFTLASGVVSSSTQGEALIDNNTRCGSIGEQHGSAEDDRHRYHWHRSYWPETCRKCQEVCRSISPLLCGSSTRCCIGC